MNIAALICLQLEKGIPEEQILESVDIDTEYEVDFRFYIDFILENNFIAKDEKTGIFKITKSGREFIDAFLPEE
jgi:predicted transcriptional regulator